MTAIIKTKRTALVTGASAGIGMELATLFAKSGHDLVLVARSAERLRSIGDDLMGEYGIAAHVITADLTDSAAPRQIFARTSELGLTIDFLVNNAGFGTSGAFVDLPIRGESDMVEVNVAALLKLTHLYARPMVEQGFGRILNIASTAAFQPGPFMATYYATKAFVVSFSEALAFELDGTGVTVTAHCPGATATEFAARAGSDKSALFQRGSVATSREVAEDAYRAMNGGDTLAIHGTKNWLMMQSLRLAPRALVRRITAGLNRPG